MSTTVDARLPLLLVLVLLGNGLRSVVTSAVFVSESAFASFLKISVNKTSVIIELLLGAVLLSLLIGPRLIQRYPIRPLATVMCLAAGTASLGLAVLFFIAPPVAVREAAVIVLFPLLGMSLASLAPLAQLMTGWGGQKNSKLLTGVWALAMPVAFLVTPQLVRVVAPRYGLEGFFASFAFAPLFLILAVWMVRQPATATPQDGQAQQARSALLPLIIVLVTFEAATALVTLLGITSPATQGAGIAFLAALGYLLIANPRAKAPSHPGERVDSAMLGVFAFLFLVNVATTGFFDTAYLVEHMCSNTLIADRASFGALAQAAAAIGTTAILARFSLQRELMLAGAVIAAIGLGSYMTYFGQTDYWLFIGSKAVTSFGTGLLTTAAIFFVSNDAGRKASLALYIAFVIIVGTEVGLEAFEILRQVLELMLLPSDRIYALIFVSQCALVLIALPFVWRWEARQAIIGRVKA